MVFLKDRFKAPQDTIDPKLGKRIEQVARKLGTIAHKTKNPGVFGSQFKIIENGSIINYSPHTAWVREDGKQPMVIRHDGLAFVPDPRVYDKCGPAQLKDFVAYNYLPRSKPRISDKEVKQTKPTGSKIQKQTPKGPENPAGKSSTPTSPKRKPPKNIEELIRQITNRRTLGQQRIHKTTPTTSKSQPLRNPPTATKNLKSPSRKRKGSAEKARRDNKHREFECDTSISISSDDSINQDVTQSLHMPPANKIDRKNTPPQEIIPSRRSTRTKTSALANKFGNPIAINTIANDTTADSAVCHITVQRQQDQNAEPIGQAAGTTHESSTDIECIEINSTDETPKQLRVQETNEGTGGQITSIGDTSDPDDTLYTPTKTTTHSTSPQSNPSDKFVSKLNTSAQRGSPQSPIQRAVSSRYVIDRPTGSSCSPDKSFSDRFNDEMKILKSISPTKNSMTFQRECERQDRLSVSLNSQRRRKAANRPPNKYHRHHRQRTPPKLPFHQTRTLPKNRRTYDVLII